MVTNYFNKYKQIEETQIDLITEKDNNDIVNLQLVNSNKQLISPNSDVLVRNFNSKGEFTGYERKSELNARELAVLKNGEKEYDDAKGDPYKMYFTNGPYLETSSSKYTHDKYDLVDIDLQFNPTPPPPPFKVGETFSKFQGDQNYWVNASSQPVINVGKDVTGQLGDILKGALSSVAQRLRNPDSKINTVIVNVNQTIGANMTSDQIKNVTIKVDLVIDNAIKFLKSQTKGRNINFVRGSDKPISTGGNAGAAANSGLSLQFIH